MRPPNSCGDPRRLARLAAAVAAIATTWLVVLPWVGSLGPVRNYIRRNESAGVNPGAMYYTEIDAIGAISERMDGAAVADRRLSDGPPSSENRR